MRATKNLPEPEIFAEKSLRTYASVDHNVQETLPAEYLDLLLGTRCRGHGVVDSSLKAVPSLFYVVRQLLNSFS